MIASTQITNTETFAFIAVLQPLTKYLRQTLVFMSNSAVREKFNLSFSAVFC